MIHRQSRHASSSSARRRLAPSCAWRGIGRRGSPRASDRPPPAPTGARCARGPQPRPAPWVLPGRRPRPAAPFTRQVNSCAASLARKAVSAAKSAIIDTPILGRLALGEHGRHETAVPHLVAPGDLASSPCPQLCQRQTVRDLLHVLRLDSGAPTCRRWRGSRRASQPRSPATSPRPRSAQPAAASQRASAWRYDGA